MQIGCSTYSFRKEIARGKYTYNDAGFSSLKEHFPAIQGWELGQELLEQFYKKTEPKDLLSLKEIINSAGFEWFALTIPSGSFGNANLIPFYSDYDSYVKGFDRDHEFRIGFAEEWMDNAAALGIKLMRIDGGSYHMDHKINYSRAFDFNLQQNITVYTELCKMAADRDIQIGIENHGGFFSDINVLRKLFAAVPDLKWTFDFGNVTDDDRFIMAEEFADRINFCHAKAYIFNEDHDEPNIDFGKILGILKDRGFDGWLSIEFEGPSDGDSGVQKTIELIQKYI
jgi:sugar phosphate isomerase/epimerase